MRKSTGYASLDNWFFCNNDVEMKRAAVWRPFLVSSCVASYGYEWTQD